MTGPLKLARALTPVALAGLLCGSAAATTTIPGSPPRIADPCSPDGACLPRYATWGWYETRWRPFPGDVVAGPPTLEDAGDEDDESLGGPRLPQPDQEGSVGPAPRAGAASGGAVPEGGAAPAPRAGEAPLDAVPVPTLEPEPGVIPAPGVEPAPGAAPDPLDPFGAAPPTPPSWMPQPLRNASNAPRTAAATGVAAPAPAPHSPNLDGDDAPPSLPTSLQGSLNLRAQRPAWNAGAAATLLQPTSVRPRSLPTVDRGVVRASAHAPLGIQLINPAAAVAVEASDDGLQQAIYIEASDLPAELPADAPAN